MALPKKGLRKLDHDGKKYGWKVGKDPYYCHSGDLVNIVIQQMDVDKTQVLSVRFNIIRANRISYNDIYPVTPANIIDIIDTALDKGWKPDAGGKPFQLEYDIRS